ncbi:MAG: hypothetical protein ACXWYE_11385 [Actinomycetota bacterium]
MPAGRYTVMDGDGSPVGTEEFRCAPGPMGWRFFSDVRTSEPEPHQEVVDLAVDVAWWPARVRIATGSHELLLTREGDRLSGWRDGEPLELAFGPEMHLDYLSPAFNAVTVMRLFGTAEIDAVCLEAVTLEPRPERQRYEDLGTEEVATPVGTFVARRWRHTSLGSGWTRALWVVGDLVVRNEGLCELEWYEAGASGPRPLT